MQDESDKKHPCEPSHIWKVYDPKVKDYKVGELLGVKDGYFHSVPICVSVIIMLRTNWRKRNDQTVCLRMWDWASPKASIYAFSLSPIIWPLLVEPGRMAT